MNKLSPYLPPSSNHWYSFLELSLLHLFLPLTFPKECTIFLAPLPVQYILVCCSWYTCCSGGLLDLVFVFSGLEYVESNGRRGDGFESICRPPKLTVSLYVRSSWVFFSHGRSNVTF